jgi:hypothetical protein
MKLPKWFRKFVLKHAFPSSIKNLREFIYLDEVSLRSLLSSQNGGMTDSMSEQTARTWSLEGGTTASIGTDALGKAGGTSRFQTSNSSTLQTSKKATVQSWFRELHIMSDLRLLSVVEDVKPFTSPDEVKQLENTSVTISSELLARGSLIEMRIRLTADPIFQIGTIFHEIMDMARDFPEQIAAEIQRIPDAEKIQKLLDRLLAGLIPIRSEAIDYAVVEIDSQEYVVHRDALNGLALEARPLYVVGVTEHLAYWKDIRRVLFSGGVFTIMCRISRDGLHDDWAPVKLTELFKLVAPDMANQLAGAAQFIQVPRQAQEQKPKVDERLAKTLSAYKTLLLDQRNKVLTEDLEALVHSEIVNQSQQALSPEGQRAAFDAVKKRTQALAGIRISPEVDIQLREKARSKFNLPYFPQAASQARKGTEPIHQTTKSSERLLDTEVVAIYW